MFLCQKPEGTPKGWLLMGLQRGPQEGILLLPQPQPSQGHRRVFPAWAWVELGQEQVTPEPTHVFSLAARAWESVATPDAELPHCPAAGAGTGHI